MFGTKESLPRPTLDKRSLAFIAAALFGIAELSCAALRPRDKIHILSGGSIGVETQEQCNSHGERPIHLTEYRFFPFPPTVIRSEAKEVMCEPET